MPGSAGWKSIFIILFSRFQIIHRQLLSNTCRENHETSEHELEIVRKTAGPLSTNIDKYRTGFTTHRWMRKRCSKGFLEQRPSSPCLIADNTSNTVTRRHTTDGLPAPPVLYLAGSTSCSTQLIGTAEFAVIFRKYYPVRPPKKLITRCFSFHFHYRASKGDEKLTCLNLGNG